MNEPETVFVVDDDTHVLASVDALLRGNGYAVRCFSCGADFLAAVNVPQIGCVLSDLQMPEMTGAELQEQLLARGSTLGLIVVTGYADVPSTVRIMEKGAVTLLEKPYDGQSLMTVINKALEHSRDVFHRRASVQDAIAKISLLDEEELQVMECAIRGMPVKAISDHLTMSNRTVDRRRQSALTKAKVSSISEFAILLATSRQQG